MKLATVYPYRIVIGLLTVGLVFLYGCSGTDTDTVESDNTASIGFKLRFIRDVEVSTTPITISAVEPDICEDYQISEVEIGVFRSDDNTSVLSEPEKYDCSDHETNRISVPPDVNLYVTFIAYVDNDVCWTATKSDVSVPSNDTDNVEFVDLEYQCDDQEGPELLNQYPQPDAENVDTGESISVSFNEALAPSSVYDEAIILSNDDGEIPGDIVYARDTYTIIFNPRDSLLEDIYTVTLDNDQGITDTAKNPFNQTLTWQFSTFSGTKVPPTVVSTSPIGDASEVSIETEIRATFSKPIDFSTVGATEFTVVGNSISIPGELSYEDTSRTLSFKPDSTLETSTLFTATISDQVTDTDGIQMGTPYQWQFTTKAPTIETPTNLRWASGFRTLEWDPNTTTPDGYRIYYTYNVYSTPIWTGTSTSASLTGLPEGTHYFVVRAFIGGVESGNSNSVSLQIIN
jgi:hypothetical protein